MSDSMSNDAAQLFRATVPQKLLGTQRPAVQVILKGFLQIAGHEPAQRRTSRPETVDDTEIDVDRPHQVYLIDGKPGAGKTYTLLSVEYAIRQFSAYVEHGQVAKDWRDFFERRIFDSLGDSQGQSQDVTLDRLRHQHQFAKRRLAQTVQVIFPGDLLVNESLMEALFARMAVRLREEVASLQGQAAPTWSAGLADQDADNDTARRLKAIRRLQTDLTDTVEQGWYFANRFGLEALIRDSSDYRDLVSRWGEESGKAAARIKHWRSFVHKYLDAFNTTTLVVLVDDSDQRHELTEDILHSIRMFLNHPRIMTIVAGNLKSMRDTLLHRSMEQLSRPISALNQQGHPAAREWRRRERQSIEEYLAKVLPPEKRIHVSRPTATGDRDMESDLDRDKAGKTYGSRGEDKALKSDFAKIAGQELRHYQLNALRLTRKPFLMAKFKLALARELQRIDAPTQAQRGELEQFLAWWLFTNMYTDVLAPQSARQISTFAALYQDWFGTAWAALDYTDFEEAIKQRDLRPKRLPVMLFDNTANYTLIQRLSDEDSSLSDWLRRQPLTSSWSGRRYFGVDGREAHDGSFTYNYLRYRLDVGLSMPIRDNAEEVIPSDLLPRPVGRRFMRRFFQPRQMARRHRRIGVSRWLEHAAIPGNCLYFHDLQALPDISFFPNSISESAQEAQQTGSWEAQLADRWHELIEDRHENAEDEYLVRYFCEIVCESLQHTENLSSAALIGELDPPDINEKRTRAIYEHFLRDELGIFSAPRRARKGVLTSIVSAATAERGPKTQPDTGAAPAYIGDAEDQRTLKDHGQQFPPASPLRMIALYSAMITDLRRAWHAIRIYEALPMHLGGALRMQERDIGKQNSLAIIANRDRMKLFRRRNIEALIRQGEWGARVLDVFGQSKLSKVFKDKWPSDADEQTRIALSLSEAHINQIYSVQGSAPITGGSQIIGEDADFKSWTGTLRAIGRAICNRWPVTDADGSQVELEEALFDEELAQYLSQSGEESDKPNHVMLKIFRSNRKKDENAHRAEEDRRRANTRAARNIVMLLYGLAPSLPAVIHVDIMSRIYEAELRARSLLDLPQVDPESQGDPAQIKKMRESIKQLFDQTLDEIGEWAHLIGTLAVMVRYIKIKCLHLDTAIILDEALNTSNTDAAAAAAAEEAYALFKHCGYRVRDTSQGNEAPPKIAREAAMDFIQLLRGGENGSELSTWSGFQCGTVAEGLAVFPDVSPSSLLGDGWLKDILTRGGVTKQVCEALTGKLQQKNPNYVVELASQKGSAGAVASSSKLDDATPDDPLSINGIFGETEQWLWAASRTLRKLHLVLENRSRLWVASTPESAS